MQKRVYERETMNSKNFKVKKIQNNKEHYYIHSEEDGVFVLKNGNVSPVFYHCYWESKTEAEIFLAGWLVLNPPPEPYVFKAGDIVEVTNPSATWCIGGKRVILRHPEKRYLIAVDQIGKVRATAAPAYNSNFRLCHYQKIGELKDLFTAYRLGATC